MKIHAPTYTQAPNELFDEWLTKLSHIQLKVLMVIMRKTFGWHKIRDRISLSQLELLTGSGRSKIIKATKALEKLNLITKEVVGKNGEQQTYYELVVIEDSNNLYQCPKDTPPSVQKTPTKEKPKENKKEIYKEKTRGARTAATKITFDPQKRSFDGISIEDRKSWKEKFPALNLDKELGLCAEWALSTHRDNYRKSILTWLRNTQEKHTTAYVPKEEIDVLDEDIKENIRLAKDWEIKYNKNRINNYDLQATPSKLIFVLPNNQGFSVDYHCSTEEFKKKCQTHLIRMQI